MSNPSLIDGLPNGRRFQKDILRTGVFQLPHRAWDVTKETLDQLVDNFRLARSRGVRVPVTWNHSRDARDQIGSVAELFRAGSTLYARFSAPRPADSERLLNINHDVSVAVSEDFRDGLGNQYDLMLTHLAVVDSPVVPGQRSFLTLSRFPMLADTGGAVASASPVPSASPVGSPEEPTASQELASLGAELSVDESRRRSIVEGINALLEEAGIERRLSLDAGAVELLNELRAIFPPATIEAEKQLAPTDEPSEADRLRRELALERERSRSDRRSAFIGAVDRLMSAGRVVPAERSMLLKLGESSEYSLSALTPFERIPAGGAAPTSTVCRRYANADPPAITSSRGTLSRERIRQIATTFSRPDEGDD